MKKSSTQRQLEYVANVIASREGKPLREPVLQHFVCKVADLHDTSSDPCCAFFIEPISGPAPSSPTPIIIGRAYRTIWGIKWTAEGRNGWEEIADSLNEEWTEAHNLQRLHRKAYGYLALLLVGAVLILQALCGNGSC